ncbi:dTDP-4-dehydrorhamnose reductase [Brevibacterium album]|uniref:dTDP-4-dehydrorhamnose reductase n=1 Tax=Brevibacterium album TaxID=417948 RepID=UPI00041B152A|nr:dTDP-4-dehydrorhamnose reductase [Brevibacterium album]
MSTGADRLAVRRTPIPGLLVVDLPLHGDARGWFKENWQREKMVALGLPDFRPVQNNISFNADPGTTRGIHAEPWDKYVSVATGRIFGAWVDLREGPSFGTVFHMELGPDTAVYVPRGVGNAFQALEGDTAYVYLVNDHWTAAAQAEYTFLNLADESAAIPWPIPLDQAVVSDRDRAHPQLSGVRPMRARPVLVLGANGQLGRALRKALPDAEFADRARVDIADPRSLEAVNWYAYSAVVNAAAYTQVDAAETPEGRAAAWRVNAGGPAELARRAQHHGFTLVHISSDYVFDGESAEPYTEDAPLSPLSVYGQSKAAGDLAAALAERHYILRTSWVVGDGANFVRTMAALAQRGIDPTVVDDQHGRLTFADDLAAAVAHLLGAGAEYGTYNVSCEGPRTSWAQIARQVFELTGHDPARVVGATAEEYFAGRSAAPRPANSMLALTKLERTGFTPRTATDALTAYLAESPPEGA